MNNSLKSKLLMILLSLLFLQLVFIPVYEFQNTTISKIQQNLDFISKTNSLINSENKIEIEISELQRQSESLNKYFILDDGGYDIKFQSYIEEILNKYNLSIVSKDFFTEPLNTVDDISTYYVDVGVEGDIQNLLQLLVDLSSPDQVPKIYINNLDIKSKSPKGSIVKFRADLIIKAFIIDNVRVEREN